jgi:hypothetical protein
MRCLSWECEEKIFPEEVFISMELVKRDEKRD